MGIINSLPYILFVFLYVILAIYEIRIKEEEVRKKQIIRIVCISFYILFFGFRGLIGWDWYNYYPFFEKLPLLNTPHFSKIFNSLGFEIGFKIYSLAIKTLISNYNIYVLISTIINVTLLNIFLKRYTTHYAFAFLIYLVMGGIPTEIDLLRNSKSIFLFLISLKYVHERKFIPFLICNLIGVSFHTTSILFIPLYFVLTKVFSRNLFIILFIIGNLIFVLQIQYLEPILKFVAGLIGGKVSYLVSAYFEISGAKAYGLTIGYIERIISFLLLIIYHDKLLKGNTYNVIFINSFMIYFLLFFYFGEIRIVTLRITNLFYYPYWILMPAIYENIKIHTNKNIFLVYLVATSLLKTNGLTNLPNYKYDNFILNEKSYNERIPGLKKALQLSN